MSEFHFSRACTRTTGLAPSEYFIHLRLETGTTDNWDPAVTDGLARDREVILFNNAGISSSGGETPNTIAKMARDAAVFIDALGLKQIDLLGFSLGGFVAQQLTLDRPKQVRRLVLVGTGPRSGEGMATLTPEAKAIFGKTYEVSDELWLKVFFSPTETSQATGQTFLKRLRARKEHRDPPINENVVPAQIAAVEEWGARRQAPYAYLKNIKKPVLVVSGSNDVIVYTVNSFILQRNLPNAQLIIYPDSNHGSQYQFPELFVEHVNLFLGEPSIGR
jgi:pimeloyl-ACP methyl ester carboxylesterase